MKDIVRRLTRTASMLRKANLDALFEETKSKYDQMKKNIFRDVDFPIAFSKFAKNASLYTFDEFMKYTELYTILRAITELRNTPNARLEEKEQTLNKLEERFNKRYADVKGITHVLGQAIEQVRVALRKQAGEQTLNIDRQYEPVRGKTWQFDEN